MAPERTTAASATAHRQSGVPLSDAQARLLDLEAHLGGGAVHVFALAFELDGALDVGALEAALAYVTRAHFALRVRVDVDGGRRVFVPTTPPVMTRRSMSASDATGYAAYRAVLREEAARPIDLSAGAGWRTVLIERGPDSFTFVVQFHHAIADRGSVGAFMVDLGAAYRAITGGQSLVDPVEKGAPLSAPSPDAAETSRLITHWRSLFTPPPAALQIPGASLHGNFQHYEGERIEAHLGAQLTTSLKNVADMEQSSLFAVLLAGFAATLHAHTGQYDLVVCTPMMGRHRAGTRRAIGYFNNIVPLRLDVSGNPTFQHLIGRVSARLRDALENQDLPFHEIAALPVLAGSRLTHCLFALQNIPGLRIELPGVKCRYFDIANGTANFDIALFMDEMDGGIVLLLDHKSVVVPSDAGATLQRRYFEVLGLVAERPEMRLDELPRFAVESGDSEAGASVTAEDVDDSRHGPETKDTELERRIIEQWREVFRSADGGVVDIDAESHFLNMGGDSIRAARLFKRIEDLFGHRLPLATLLEAPTPRAIAQRLANESWVAPWLALLPVKATGARPPLFCLHGGGGNVLQFGFIAQRVHPEQPLYCLQPYELERGALSSVEEMAAHYIAAIRKLRPHGPYLFAGASLGGAVVYEMAQRLVAEGESVPFVGLIDYAGPGVRFTLRDKVREHVSYVRTLSWSGRADYVRRRVARRFGMRPRVQQATGVDDAESADAALIEASVRALQNYVVRPYSGRVSMFRAKHGSPAVVADAHGGWGEITASVEVFDVSGDHITITRPPHVFELADAFARALSLIS